MSRVLVVNAGSTSTKLRLLDGDALERSADLPAGADVDLAGWPEPDAVGHRIVHGGGEFHTPTLVDAGVRERLERLTALAPLHQPPALAALDAVTRGLPDVRAVACFDTAFHATLPPAASTYAVPTSWREQHGVRRYGFHGLSHAWCAGRAPQLAGRPARRLVSCHLGGGASLAAIVDGRSVDTTMGFTPLEGVVMATRSGTVDPGLVLWMQSHAGLDADTVADDLERRSGLLGLGGSADLRELLAAGTDQAVLAVDVYVHRLVTGIGAMAAACGGLDVLAFTGGVGEHAPIIRARVTERLAWLGVQLDTVANDDAQGDGDITAAVAGVATVVVTSREDLQIAGEVRRTVG